MSTDSGWVCLDIASYHLAAGINKIHPTGVFVKSTLLQVLPRKPNLTFPTFTPYSCSLNCFLIDLLRMQVLTTQ